MEKPPRRAVPGPGVPGWKTANVGTPVPRCPPAHPCGCQGIAPTPGSHAHTLSNPLVHPTCLLTNVMIPMRSRS